MSQPFEVTADWQVRIVGAVIRDQSNENPIWLLMPDSSTYINQVFLKDATTQPAKLIG